MKFATFALAASLIAGSAAACFAQTTSPLPAPYPQDNTPRPFNYPEGLNSPTFTLEENPAAVINFGDFPVILDQTPLSVVTKVFGGKLHHLPDRTDYLCYSAPLQSDPYAPKPKRRKKADEEQEPVYIGQNIWLIVGPRGQISEARAEAVTEDGELCPALAENFQDVSFGPLRIGTTLSAAAMKKENLPQMSASEEDSPWKFWFANKAQDRFNLRYGFLGAELNDKQKILKLFSVEIEFKDK